jgi:ATP-dependent Lhr-like helicase
VRPHDYPEWQAWFGELAGQRRAAVAETADGDRLWFAAENLRLIEAIYPRASVRPEVRLPEELLNRLPKPNIREEEGAPPSSAQDYAAVALVRGHIEVLGPVTVQELAGRTALGPGAVASALAQAEGEGAVLRGRFRALSDEEEWCDRRLLARIHRYTLDRLRAEIEPVSAQDLMRFLLRWQHVAPGTQLEGKRGLLEAVTQIQGFDVPALAWERHILPARVAAYKGSWLDELCMAGDVAWARMAVRPKAEHAASAGARSNGRTAAASAATPVSLARRADLAWLVAGVRNSNGPEAPRAGAAADIMDLLRSQGALFHDDIAAGSRRLPTDVERGLWELVARGLATADGFQALRALMASTRKRQFRRPQRARLFRTLAVSGVPSGRWSLLPSVDREQWSTEELAEAWAEQLLFRYGVVFRDLVQREDISVPWREVLRALRRMEAQGTVRGGRFVAGFYGEQYARPEAVEGLRSTRRAEKKGELVRVSAVDPLNLAGITSPGPKVPAVHTKAVVYRDGIPLSEEEATEAFEARKLAAVS